MTGSGRRALAVSTGISGTLAQKEDTCRGRFFAGAHWRDSATWRPIGARTLRRFAGKTQLYQGRVRLQLGPLAAANARRASLASSSTCQSNMPTRMKSAPLLKA